MGEARDVASFQRRQLQSLAPHGPLNRDDVDPDRETAGLLRHRRLVGVIVDVIPGQRTAPARPLAARLAPSGGRLVARVRCAAGPARNWS